jgi:hypothetical protein
MQTAHFIEMAVKVQTEKPEKMQKKSKIFIFHFFFGTLHENSSLGTTATHKRLHLLWCGSTADPRRPYQRT